MKPVPILLIEDDDNDVFFFERAIKKAELSAHLTVLRDGQAAIEYFTGTNDFADRAKHPLPWLTFLDLNLPQKHGLEVLRFLRESNEIDKMPVIVLTSSTSEQDIREAYNLGANSYFTKPSDADKLVDLLKQIEVYWLKMSKLPPACKGRAPLLSNPGGSEERK